MTAESNPFGCRVRMLREERRIGLRKFAALVGMSPTYLSKVERGEFPPPSEEKIVAIAEALEQDQDELLALAGRVASDLHGIIQRRPRLIAPLLRSVATLSDEAVAFWYERIAKGGPQPHEDVPLIDLLRETLDA